ncbi:MAG TPA: hypothetical protein VMW15_13330, partial [Terracidiphilus sp.]|nr:hypothetical protein [Terracidiphilus sp.]
MDRKILTKIDGAPQVRDYPQHGPVGVGIIGLVLRSTPRSESSPKSSVEFHSSGLLVLVLLVERGLLAEGVAR